MSKNRNIQSFIIFNNLHNDAIKFLVTKNETRNGKTDHHESLFLGTGEIREISLMLQYILFIEILRVLSLELQTQRIVNRICKVRHQLFCNLQYSFILLLKHQIKIPLVVVISLSLMTSLHCSHLSYTLYLSLRNPGNPF